MTKRILVVEDQADLRGILRDLLTGSGYEMLEAADGGEGVAKAKSERPDLILMDIQLPVLDGYETTRQIRADPNLKATPIIAVSSYAMKGDEEKARASGCDALRDQALQSHSAAASNSKRHWRVIPQPPHSITSSARRSSVAGTVMPSAFAVLRMGRCKPLTGISKSQVSRLCEEIDGRVKEFLNRPIEGSWPYVWIDATYVKVREGGRIISVATIVAVGVNTDGRREVLGKALGPSEAEPFWTQFLRSLTARGLRGVKLVISDAHEGIKAAVKKVFHAGWQRCRVHFMRNAMAHAGVKQRAMVAAAIRTAFVQETEEAARAEWRAVADRLRAKFRKLSELMDGAENEVLA